MTINAKFEELEVRTRGSVKYTYLYRPRFVLTVACAAMILLAMADVTVGEVRALLQ